VQVVWTWNANRHRLPGLHEGGVISVLSSRFSFLRSEISVSTDIFQRLCYTGVILSEPKSSRSDFSASMSSKVDSIGGDRYVVNLSVAVYSPPAL